MKKAVHFGAGNIGRGFIGQILFDNDFAIDFVDVNTEIINALNARHAYEIEIAEDGQRHIAISNVSGINNKENPQAVVEAIAKADLITTAIGPTVLPFIAELIAKGLKKRYQDRNHSPLDVIACENMIGGSSFLKSKVDQYLSSDEQAFVQQFIGFPNAAVDRIVPTQVHDDPLFVVVEPFSEWVVETSSLKNKDIVLAGVHYEENLEPFIERKLFSVNSGHATTAYTGAYYGAQTILEALKNKDVRQQVKAVLAEIRQLLIAKWNFQASELENYHDIILSRFENPYIVDDIARVARTPIRKLGYDERFIRPIRELKERQLSYQNLLKTVAFVLAYRDESDEQSQKLQQLLAEKPLKDVITEVSQLDDQDLVAEIAGLYQTL